mmetsp:Transcript_60285/g.135768  ORF Transcript_60285/g.135768 Transcript_60285/m.135768 type:complete len:83 (-) Transcript_60285:1099-1347(-)
MLGEAARMAGDAEPTEGTLPIGLMCRIGEAHAFTGTGAPPPPVRRGRMDVACCSFVIQVFGLRSITRPPSPSTFSTTAGNQS